MHIKTIFKLNVMGLFLLALAGCGSAATPGSSYDTSSSEVIAGAIAGSAGSSDNGGSVVAMNESAEPQKASKLFALESLEPKAQASVCTASAQVMGAACSTTTMTLALSGCTGTVGAWNGSYLLTYNAAGTCTNANGGGLIAMGASNSVTITSAAGVTLTTTTPSGFVVSTDSNASGFSSSVGGGTAITCGATNCSTSRTVNILGVHRTLSNASSVKLFDHTLSTPTAFTITGTGSGKQITAGSIQLQHNLAKFIATSTITTPLTFTAGCCQPTGGSITTTFSSGKTGTETTTFGPTCGAATVGGTAVTLSYCQ